MMGASARDTIFALSSGALPAGIAVVRVSGPRAGQALEMLAAMRPQPRRATSAMLHDADGEMLDRALILWMPGPGTATGEDIAEFHLHGGRAVVAAVQAALGSMAGLRPAEAGEFTRRAFLNGRLDLAQAEGLADLLAAETEAQRRQALRQAEGGLGKLISGWRERLLDLSARVEAAIEFGEDEDEVPALPPDLAASLRALREEIGAALAQPPAERLRDGVRIVLAGPVNAGKSSLINVLSGRDAAITSAVAGTTRDIIEVPVNISGMPCLLWDSAGLRDAAGHVESLGVERSRQAIAGADLILWLGAPGDCPYPDKAVRVHSKADLGRQAGGADIAVSAVTGEGIPALRALLEERVRSLLPPPDAIALNQRQQRHLAGASGWIGGALTVLEDQGVRGTRAEGDILIVAENLRLARLELDHVTGRAGVEDMLDALFGRFCIGK
jgi:tRNA modification GTPase